MGSHYSNFYGGVDNRYTEIPFLTGANMNVDKFIDTSVFLLSHDLSRGIASCTIVGTVKQTGEPVDMVVALQNVYNTQMLNDTIDAAIEEELGLQYQYTFGDLEQMKKDDIKKILASI